MLDSLLKSIASGVSLLLLVTAGARAQGFADDAPLPTEFISVGDYSGTANERINAAIAAAMATDHKTVLFPNGTYALRTGLSLDQGTDTELHLIGESRDGVFLIPDIPYLEANYNGGDWQNGGARLAHMINLSSASVFDSVDVSIQNLTVDMRHQLVMGEGAITYNVVGHGIRVGQGWVTGQFMVNHVTIRNVGSYGVGIQDRDGHPKSNITLTNLHVERSGSDGIDTKEASGDGNRNLVIRNVSMNQVGFLDTGAAPCIDLRYRDVTIENVNLVSRASQSTLPGQTSSISGINFRPFDGGLGVVGATVSNVYIRGTNGIRIHAADSTPHQNIAVSDFRIQGQNGVGLDILGTAHSGHSVSDGLVDPGFGGAAINANGQATVTNVTAGRWDPALTPTTHTTFETHVSLAGETFSPALAGMVGSEQVSLNPTSPVAGPFTFDVSDTGVMQIDYDGTYNATDRLIVDGTLNLDGEFRINLVGGTPVAGGTFQVFEADAITGSFDTLILPTVPGLTWLTDELETNGTIRLLEVSSITFGDTDNTDYDPLSPDDNPPVDAAFATSLANLSSSYADIKGLDETGRNAMRAMTFSFTPLDAGTLDGVWVEARVLGESGYENDAMILDAVGNNRGTAAMQGFTTDGDWMTLRYAFDPSEFTLLSDGQLNLGFFDDTRVDWVRLSWFIDPAPVIASLSPGNTATDVPLDANLVLTFSEDVVAGSGLLTLRRTDDDGIVETFDVSDPARVPISGRQVTLDPAADLSGLTSYYVTVDPTAFDDLQGKSFAGLSLPTDWTFTTASDRVIIPINSDSRVVASSLGGASTSMSFNAGADAEMLMVAVSTERSTEAVPTLTYDGDPLTLAVEQVQAGIWYLDLTQTDYAEGAADLVIDFSGVATVNGVALGAISVRTLGRPITLHATALGGESAELITTRDEAFVLASFNANKGGSPSVDAPLTTIYASGDIGSAQGAAGYQANVAAGTHPIIWTTGDKRRVAAAAFVVAGTFGDWIAEYELGGETGLDDDPDGDRLPNGVEAWFGSNPGEFSPGLANLTRVSSDFTFSHPVSSMMPDDLEGFYEWSLNLVDWYASDGVDGPVTGETVSSSTQLDAGTATVTLSPSGSLSQLFVRAAVRVIP